LTADDVRVSATELARRALALPELAQARTVAAYVSVGSEPGTLTLLDALRARGVRVLLPALLPDNDLDWGTYDGEGSLVRVRHIGDPTRPGSLQAPQATLMASVAQGLFGGKLPWDMIIAGGVIGALVIAFDNWLKSRNSNFRVPVLAAAIGIYLPLELMVPIFLGGLLAHLVEKRHGIVGAHDESLRDRVHRPGVLFSAGLITGEALMGIAIAIPIVLSERADVLALPETFHFGQGVGLVVLAVIAWRLYSVGKGSASQK
jgi:hypothetical protein